MLSFKFVVQVEAPPEAVWAVLAERYDELDAWLWVVSGCELEEAGPVGMGTTRVVKATPLVTLRETIVAFEPLEAIAYDVHGVPWIYEHMRSDWTLAASDGGTEITLSTSVKPRLGWFGRGLFWMMTPAHHVVLSTVIGGLKGFVDAEHRG
jgi:hypothetical protein